MDGGGGGGRAGTRRDGRGAGLKSVGLGYVNMKYLVMIGVQYYWVRMGFTVVVEMG